MSCSKCGSVNTSCGCKDTAYTTPKVYTCPPDTSCPQPVRCSEFMDAACIFLNDGIADAGIQPGSSLESIVQQLILLVTNPGCVDAPGGVPGGGTVTFIDAVWPGNAITIAGGPISNSGTFVFNGNGTSLQYIDGQGNLQTFPSIPQAIEFQTNGTPNSTQDLLNLVAGTGITLTESGGSVTIDVDAVDYSVQNGLSEQPLDSGVFELGGPASPGAPLLHDTYIDGSQYAFEITDTSSMYLQGNRVDIEGADPGVMMLSTGGASDNSVEVNGTEVAIESVGGAGTTKIFLDPAKIRIQTPLYSTKLNNDVLTLIDRTTGEVEFMPPASILLQTNGSDNADQALLNLVSGNGITLTNVGGDVTIDGPLFQTDGTDNSTQTLLNLVAGTGITLTESGGSVTIDADAPAINLTTNDTGGAATYNSGTGDLNIPIYQSQIDFQEEGSSVVVNPLFVNFIGTAVTVTSAAGGTGVNVTITGGGPSANVDANNGLLFNTTNPALPIVQLGGPDALNPAPLIRDTYINADTFDFYIDGNKPTKPTLWVNNINAGTGLRGESATGIGVYGVSASGYSGYFDTGSGSVGLYSVNNAEGLAGQFETISLNTNGVIPVVLVQRTTNNSTTPAEDGFGGSIQYSLETDTNAALVVGSLAYILTSVDNTDPQSKFTVNTLSGSSNTTKLEVLSTGQLVLNEYTTSSSFDPDSGPSVGVLNVDNAGNVFVGSGTGLSIQVDGTPFSSSSLLNFTTSADIGVTDLGGGAIQFSLATPIVAYTSNEGVYDDSDVFKLGAPNPAGISGGSAGAIPFTLDREVNTSTHTLFFTGTAITNQYILDITNTVGSGIKATANADVAIDAYGNSGGYVIRSVSAGTAIGVGGSSKNGQGGSFSSTNFKGLTSSSESNFSSAEFTQTTQSSVTVNQVVDTVSIYRGINSTSPVISLLSAGGGTGILTALDGTGPTLAGSGTGINASRLVTKWFTAQSVSEFEIQTKNAASTTLDTKFAILGGGTSGAFSLFEGQIKFNKYAGGAIYKSANDLVAASGFNLGIDANGNIWATDFESTTGPVSGVANISIGTLSNGASATVTNPSGPAATINITGQNAYTQISADSGSASADVYNAAFSVVGADGITTSVTNDTSPNSDVITVTGPDKYLNFVTKNISGGTIATYTPTIWNETLNIQAGTGITITNGGSANTIVISGGAGTGTVSNVTGANANGFTVGVTNGTTTPEITVGTSINGVLVGNGTAVSAVTGTGVMVFSGTSYSFQALPTVNDGAIVIGANAVGATNTSVAIVNSAGGGFTANKASNSTYLLNIGPAIGNLVTLMTAAMPVNPASSAGAQTALPPYIIKTGQDTYTLGTPVTTFSTGTTGLTLTSAVSTATSLPINGAVVLGGVLATTNGGTGTTSAPGPGQILVGDGAGGYTVTNITGGTGITVSSGSGTLQISATGITPDVLNGLHIHALDGSIRLGSGSTGDIIRPLLESTDIRMDGQFYRLSNGNTGIISAIGFQINDAASAKVGFFGSSTGGNATTANTPQVGFIFSGVGGTPLTSYSGFYIDNTGGDVEAYYGFSSNVRQVIVRSSTAANNKITQVGTWGTTADQTFYEAIPSARTIQIGSTGGNNNWIKLDDANQRVDISKSIIYATGYGLGAVTGASLAALIAVDPTGKFYEFAGRSISQITGNTGATFNAASMASATAPVAFSIQGSGTISTSITGNVMTISNSATAFPYWSTLALQVAAGTTGTVAGDPNVVPNTVGANTLNLLAGNNITLTGADASNRIQIDAIVPTLPNSWGNITLGGNATPVSPSVPGLVLSPDQVSDGLTIIAGSGIAISVASNTDTFTISNTGISSIVSSVGGSVSVSTTNGVTTITGPSIWNTIAVPTPGGSLPAQTSLTPDQVFDTLNFAAGPGITIATNNTTDTLTISATAATPTNAWFTIAAGNQSITPDATQDTLTFVGGTGIGVTVSDSVLQGDRVQITNTGVTSIIAGTNVTITSTGANGTGAVTINAAAGSAVNADQGLWKDTTVTPNEIELGSPTDGPAAFTVDRFINANANTLFIKGTPGAGDADLVVTSNSTGRAIRAINTGTSPEGAIYAIAPMDSSVDSSPTGTIYAESTAKGHAIVGVANGADVNAIAAVFGTGRQGVKGYTTVANGIGVFAQSVTGLGTGVFAEAVGNGTTSYAGVFGITNTTIAKQEVVKVSKAPSGIGEGTTIGFYGSNKQGQIGYVSDVVLASSNYEATVVPSAGVEIVRHRINSNGQHQFSAYIDETSFPLPATGLQLQGIMLAANVNATGTNIGKIYTIRNESGRYTSSVAITPAATVGTPSPTFVINGKMVTVYLTSDFTYTDVQTVPTGTTVTKTLTFSLPAQAPFSSGLNWQLVFQSYRSTTYFSNSSCSVSGTNATVTLTQDVTMPANFVNKFNFIISYLTT